MDENEESSQLLSTIEAYLTGAIGKIHAGDVLGAKSSVLKAVSELIKDRDFARAHGDIFDRAIGLATVCMELAATEKVSSEISESALKLLSGAIQIRLEIIRNSVH
ncbi:MAG: hypothetical protein HYZ18_00485 [Pseudogulbenkiania sp.]|nr:hypothetical protein [Pseudogulbenkiania sp.]